MKEGMGLMNPTEKPLAEISCYLRDCLLTSSYGGYIFFSF